MCSWNGHRAYGHCGPSRIPGMATSCPWNGHCSPHVFVEWPQGFDVCTEWPLALRYIFHAMATGPLKYSWNTEPSDESMEWRQVR